MKEDDLSYMARVIERNLGEEISTNIGDIGEQFTRAIFNCMEIAKNQPPEPDFTLHINGNPFKLETTVLEEIYYDVDGIYRDICRNQGSKQFIFQYHISSEPRNIHREDLDEFKNILTQIVTKKLPTRPSNFTQTVNCSIENYDVTLTRRGAEAGYAATIAHPAFNLINTLESKGKKEQTINSDFLLLIILNEYIEKDVELIDELYKPQEIYIHEQGDVHNGAKICQYLYTDTIWYNSDLKCVIAIYPHRQEAILYPTLRFSYDLDCSEYHVLANILLNQGFDIELIMHSSKINTDKIT